MFKVHARKNDLQDLVLLKMVNAKSEALKLAQEIIAMNLDDFVLTVYDEDEGKAIYSYSTLDNGYDLQTEYIYGSLEKSTHVGGIEPTTYRFWKETYTSYRNGTIVDRQEVECCSGPQVKDYWTICDNCGDIFWGTNSSNCCDCEREEQTQEWLAKRNKQSFAPKGVSRI